jgi:peptide/nickel transport system permease protein
MKTAPGKLLSSLLCFALILVINFLLPRLMPGDPVLMLTGIEYESEGTEAYAVYAEKLGLDRPLPVQFAEYLGTIVSGDLGYSYHHNETVGRVIAARIPGTLQIALPAVILSSLAALFLGCFAGYRKGSLFDKAFSAALIVIHAVPGFLLAMVFVAFFAFRLRWFPLGSLNSAVIPGGFWGAFFDRAGHLFLPVLTMTVLAIPGKYMLLRNSVAAAAEEKYVIYARARGLSGREILFRHILKNVCSPFITMVGLNLGFVLSGSMVIENVFSIKGMGSLMYAAVSSRDFPILQGCLLISALLVIAAGILTDLANLILDPRVRYGVYHE